MSNDDSSHPTTYNTIPTAINPMPRRSAREPDSSSEEFESQPPLRSKRRGGAARDSPPKKTRTRDRLRSAELGTPNMRSTRSTSQSTVLRTPNTGDVETRQRRQTAVRTGGRPPSTSEATSRPQSRAPRSTQGQPVVEIVRRNRLRHRVESSEGVEVNADLESEEESQPPRRSRPSREGRPAPDEDEDEDDDGIVLLGSEGELAMGTAGPGPRTSRNRRKQNLQAVPQPSPGVFHRILRQEAPQTSQLESIEDPDSSPQSSPPPETQVRRPRKSRLAVVDGVEMQIIDDDEIDEETLPPAGPSAEDYTCPMEGCDVAYKASDELADHIQTHVNLYRTKSSSKGPTPVPARVSVDRSSKVRSRSSSSDRRDQLKTQNFLTDELVKTRKELEKATTELERLKAEKGKATSTKSLIDARVEFAKQLADAEAAFEDKLKNLKEEHEVALENAQDEIVIIREQLDKRTAESAELQAMVKATEVELVNRQKAIDDLEAKLKAAGEDPDGASTNTVLTLSADAPLEDQIKERDDVIAALRKEVKSKKKALKNAKSDLSFVREQYEVASSSAVQEVNRAKELEAEAAKLREQLTLGLKQRDLINAAAMERLTKDAEQARHQLNLLLEQSRRTDDTIRRKAAQHHQLSKSNHDLEVDLHQERSRAHELSKRNDDLVAQVSELRGRLMGAFDKVDDSDSASATDSDDARAPPPLLAMPTLVPDDKPVSVPVSDATLAEAPLWQCKWLVGERMCGLYYDTREELDAHGQASHICALGPG